MASIKLRRGSGVPSGLTFGEPAFDITNSRLYVGITGGSALVGVAGGGVHSFNGLTGAVTGVTTGSANVFGPIQSFTNGISSAGGTFDSITRFSAGLCASGGTFSGTLNIPSGSTLSVLGRIVGNVVNTIHGFTCGVIFAGVNGITVDTSGAIGSAGRVNIGIQTAGSTSSTTAFSLLMKAGSTSGNVTTLSNTSDLIYYHPQSSLPVALIGATGISIRGGGGTSFLASSDINQLNLPSRLLGASINSLNRIFTIQDGAAGALIGATTAIRLYSGDGVFDEYTAIVYAKRLSTSRTYELPDASGTFALTEATQTFTAPQSFSSGLCASGVSAGSFILTSAGIRALTGTT